MVTVKSIFDFIAKLIKVFLGVLLVVMLVVALIEVFRRYILGRSFAWAEELIRYLIIWISFLGAAVAYKENNLVFFDLVANKIKGKAKMILLIITNTITLSIILFVFLNSVETILKPSILTQKSIGLQVPMVIPFLSVPLGLGLMFLFGLYKYREIIADYENNQM
ncbi:MAG: TRAP transporter small permease [Sedimentibacter sp.]|uniref:TRAP transporter small permease n=1 Tax=Sedimentibacter sp. TaxID=1960295 RepID=UPI003159226A